MKLINLSNGNRKRGAIALAAIITFESVCPTLSMALTSGPAAPEFSSFEPVATTNMVNEFSGDFTYNIPVINIPGSDGGGYALSLSYHSGETLESESSWVGYGWTLNPGAINRGKRGFADDTKSTHTFYNDVPKNWTASAGANIGNPEIFSGVIPLSASAGLRYNNYKGFGYTAGIGLSVKGIVSLGYTVSDGSGSFSASVNPGQILHAMRAKKNQEDKEKKMKEADKIADKKEKAVAQAKIMASHGNTRGEGLLGALGGIASAYGMHALGDMQMPTNVTPYDGRSFNVNTNLTLDLAIPIGGSFGASGNYTQQKNVGIKQRTAYGYMYSADAYQDLEGMMDYYTEKDAGFNKRDQYLPIPFSNADQYSVTGEGLSGGFRMHQRKVGRFRPNRAVSKTQIFQVGADFNFTAAPPILYFGAGASVGVGLQTLTMSGDDWGNSNQNTFNTYKFDTNSDEPYFFRYDGDMGGELMYTTTGNGEYSLNTAKVSASGGLGTKTAYPDLQTSSQNNSLVSSIDLGSGNTVNRSGRSSFIGYHTNDEMNRTANGNRVRAYENAAAINSMASVSSFRNNYGSQIGEFATVNEDGNTYVYGLPVTSKNERNLSYDMQGATQVSNRFIAYKSTNGTNKMMVGTESLDPYATSYLLTQITTPDYVDRKMDGPSPDDFGGYTKFEYEKLTDAGGNPTTYHWRMPYQGFYYNGGDISNPGDDMGSFSSGDKEVYYLKRIVTKTHIAEFVTSFRADGIEAASEAQACYLTTARGTNKLKKLDAINLYTNNNGITGKLIKTVRFKYDYSLCSGVPNNDGSAGGLGTGKLTLTNVWFEYEGVVPAKVSPYQFSYTYADPTSTYPFPYNYNNVSNPGYMNEYSAILAGGAAAQNPAYTKEGIDAWGNYQKNGDTRFNMLMKHVNQNPDPSFDPAAWQLKRITLPSGGEIHVQYEQDDYQYVQNRRAMALVPLDHAASQNTFGGTVNTFTIDVGGTAGATGNLGYSVSETTSLVSLINNELTNDKIYFKFLYSMIGTTAGPDQCNSDFISGYVNFVSATQQTGTTKIEIKVGTNNLASDIAGHGLPWNICNDLLNKEKSGKLNPLGNCDPADGINDDNSPVATVVQLINKFKTIFIPGSTCMAVNPDYSYFRIPLLKAKKGGGLRVKRILMYDANGVDDGQPALYGSEYIYKTANGESSGVATTEPATIREENPLISFMPKRSNQNLINKAIAGIDREQFEGPLGESILPSPAVGYSRVIAKNIHSGRTNTGFVISEFFTAKDFPFDMIYDGSPSTNFTGKSIDNTLIDEQTMQKDWMSIPAVYVNMNVNNIWVAQGYRFVKNNMHGQPKSVSTYGGTYSPSAITLNNKSSSTEYEYFRPGEYINVLNDDGTTTARPIGREEEIVNEARSIEDITEDISTSFDVSVTYIPIYVLYPDMSGSGSLSYAESKMRTFVTSKVINFPTIQKSVTSMQEGIVHKTENLAFSRYTGKPVRVRTSDGFDGKNLEQASAQNGKYVQYNIPGYTQYRELGQKAINERYKQLKDATNLTMALSPVSGNKYKLDLAVPSGGSSSLLCNALAALTVGDFLELQIDNGQVPSTGVKSYFHVDGISGTSITLLASGNYNASPTTVVTSSQPIYQFEVLRSGRTNMLNTMVGSYTTYGTSSSTAGNSGSYTLRQTLVSNLNATLSGFNIQPVNTEADVTIPLGLGLLDSKGNCLQSGIKMKFYKTSANQFYVRLYNSTTIDCSSILLNYSATAQFILDPVSGTVKYTDGILSCVYYDMPCISFCDAAGSNLAITNVIASSASTWDHIWPYNANVFDLNNTNTTSNLNDYETAAKGKWRTVSTYAYNEAVTGGAIENGTIHERVYKNAGTYTMTMFNWKNHALNDSAKWVRTSTVTKYSPNGNAIEEKDAMYIFSAAKYGYNQLVPYMVAKNADYASVNFESFENIYTASSSTYLEEKLPVNTSYISSTYAHSGSKSYMLGVSSFTVAQTNLTPLLNTAGASLKVWIKDPQHASMPVSGSIIGSVTVPLSFTKIAQTGEWSLYEAVVTNWQGMTLNGAINVVLRNNISAQPTIYVDDFRMQPLNAQANAYVYDPVSLKLLASFDDQHFGLFYQYNKEGKLVRKMVETERGIKTVTETQYNTPKKTRP
ncbi:MAG: hypothetical protein JST26_10295 [Bacteroidetes bacterium]|nr:hypothetical protein [Bacteroidota bacterium]